MSLNRIIYAVWLPLLILIPALASCGQVQEEEEKVEVTITGLSGSEVHFAAVPAGVFEMQVESTVKWTMRKSGLDWCTISPMNDLAGTSKVTFTAVVNDTDKPREGKLTISAGEEFSQTFTVRQDAGTTDPFTISGAEGNKVTFDPDDEASVSFAVYAGTPWTARVEELGWCMVSPLEGGRKQYATITLTPQKNREEKERGGAIVFSYEGQTLARVEVVQGAFVARISATPETLNAAAGGQMENSVVTVAANAAWTASVSEDWLHIDPASGLEGTTEVQISVDPQEATEERTAEIVFKNLSETAVVSVSQAARIEDKLEITPEALVFAANPEGASQQVSVTSNTIWSVSTDADWLSINTLSGNGDGCFSVSATENEDPKVREAIITVVAGTVTRTVAVSQQKGLDPADFVDLASESLNWTAGQDWDGCKLLPTSHSELAWAEWTWNNGAESVEYPEGFPTMDVNKSMNRVRCVWKDDALVFHVPVWLMPAGKTLALTFAWRGGSKAPSCWTVEASLNGGGWVPMTMAGETEGSVNAPYTDKEGASKTAPFRLTKKDSAHPFEATMTIQQELKGADLAIRIRAIDILETNGTIYADVPTSNSNCHIYIAKFNFGGVSHAGPTLSIR